MICVIIIGFLFMQKIGSGNGSQPPSFEKTDCNSSFTFRSKTSERHFCIAIRNVCGEGDLPIYILVFKGDDGHFMLTTVGMQDAEIEDKIVYAKRDFWQVELPISSGVIRFSGKGPEDFIFHFLIATNNFGERTSDYTTEIQSTFVSETSITTEPTVLQENEGATVTLGSYNSDWNEMLFNNGTSDAILAMEETYSATNYINTEDFDDFGITVFNPSSLKSIRPSLTSSAVNDATFFKKSTLVAPKTELNDEASSLYSLSSAPAIMFTTAAADKATATGSGPFGVVKSADHIFYTWLIVMIALLFVCALVIFIVMRHQTHHPSLFKPLRVFFKRRPKKREKATLGRILLVYASEDFIHKGCVFALSEGLHSLYGLQIEDIQSEFIKRGEENFTSIIDDDPKKKILLILSPVVLNILQQLVVKGTLSKESDQKELTILLVSLKERSLLLASSPKVIFVRFGAQESSECTNEQISEIIKNCLTLPRDMKKLENMLERKIHEGSNNGHESSSFQHTVEIEVPSNTVETAYGEMSFGDEECEPVPQWEGGDGNSEDGVLVPSSLLEEIEAEISKCAVDNDEARIFIERTDL